MDENKKNESLEIVEEDLNEMTEEVLDEKEQRLLEIEIKLQELEVLLDQIEFSITEENKEEKMELYQQTKEKYNELAAERKQLAKKEKTAWDKVPLWMTIYGVLLLLLCFPLLSYQIWLSFANFLLGTFETGFQEFKLNAPEFLSNFVFVLIVYAMPLLLLFLSWVMYANFVRKDFDRKVFRWIWIVQTVFTVGLAIWLYFNVIQGSL